MNVENLARIARDDDFRALIASIEAQLTARVMAAAVSQEDRDKAWHEFHAMQRVKAALGVAAYEAAMKGTEDGRESRGDNLE